jgi:hypothetical protein
MSFELRTQLVVLAPKLRGVAPCVDEIGREPAQRIAEPVGAELVVGLGTRRFVRQRHDSFGDLGTLIPVADSAHHPNRVMHSPAQRG